MTLFLVFVLVPIISFLLRLRRRRQMQATSGAIGAASAVRNVDLVRRRLHTGGVGNAGLMSRAWGEIIRVVGDTVKMAGSGLV